MKLDQEKNECRDLFCPNSVIETTIIQIDPLADQQCVEYKECDEETEELNRNTNQCESIESTVALETCDRIAQWYNPELERCEEFVNCSLRKPSISYTWKLDRQSNTCKKVKPGLKF